MTDSVYFFPRAWYSLSMESECPDPFPCSRQLPDNFELQGCFCYNGVVRYYGVLKYANGLRIPHHYVYLPPFMGDSCTPAGGSHSEQDFDTGEILTKIRMEAIERGEEAAKIFLQCTG